MDPPRHGLAFWAQALTGCFTPALTGKAVLSVLLASQRRVERQSTANSNALKALVRPIVLGLDTRRAVTDRQLTKISAWRLRTTDNVEQKITREVAVDLARGTTT